MRVCLFNIDSEQSMNLIIAAIAICRFNDSFSPANFFFASLRTSQVPVEYLTGKLQLYEKRPLIYIEQLLKSDLHLVFNV
jgi:hypothetical protein